MAILLTVPPGVISHTPGVRLQATRTRLTPAERRAMATRFLATQQEYPSVKAFAVEESARLAREGVTYPPGSIASYVNRCRTHPMKEFLWERLLAQLRSKNPRTQTYWHDAGDLSAALGFKTQNWLSKALLDLRTLHAIEIKRRRPTWDDRKTRGWEWEYRVWEANA